MGQLSLLTWNIDLCSFARVFTSFENEDGLVCLRKSGRQRKACRTGADDDVVILCNSHIDGDRICELEVRGAASVAYRSSILLNNGRVRMHAVETLFCRGLLMRE